MRKERDWLLGGDLKGEFEVVLQVLADACPVGDDIDTERAQFHRWPHSRQLQQLRRIDRPGAKDDLASSPCHLLAPFTSIADADSAAVLKGNARRERMCGYPKVGPFHCGPEIRVGGRPPDAVLHRHAERAKSFLPLAVEIDADPITRLPARLDEGVVERVAFKPI